MDAKQYMIDDKPASATEIIRTARDLDPAYDESRFYLTSTAARILREHGHTVSHNPNYVG